MRGCSGAAISWCSTNKLPWHHPPYSRPSFSHVSFFCEYFIPSVWWPAVTLAQQAVASSRLPSWGDPAAKRGWSVQMASMRSPWIPRLHVGWVRRPNTNYLLVVLVVFFFLSLCAITHLLDRTAPRCIDTRTPWQRKHMRRCRLAQLKVQLPWRGGGGELQELGCKTNKTDKQATFGADSVPLAAEIKIKKRAPCRFNTPQLNL